MIINYVLWMIYNEWSMRTNEDWIMNISIYIQETEDVYTPLHLVPPTVAGLIQAIENKYKINATNIRYIYRKNRDGIVAKIDDDMLRHYCNEDVFLMQVSFSCSFFFLILYPSSSILVYFFSSPFCWNSFFLIFN